MNRQVRARLLMLLLVTAGSAAMEAQAISTTDRFVAPFFVDSVNPCTGEPVTLSGELRARLHTTVNEDGRTHRMFALVPEHVIGEGASGATYRAVGGHREHINLAIDEAPATFMLTDTFNLISQGGGDNYSAFTLFHVTITANGAITADKTVVRLACHG